MKMNLWVLVDNSGRIYYSGKERYMVENKIQDFVHIPNLHVIELKGETDV